MIRGAITVATRRHAHSAAIRSISATSAACTSLTNTAQSSCPSGASRMRTNFDFITGGASGGSSSDQQSPAAPSSLLPSPPPSKLGADTTSAALSSSSSSSSSSTSLVNSASFSTSASTTADAETHPLESWDKQLTKIVATIGPTSEQLPVLQQLVRGGMRVMRLNFSHATVEEVELRTKNLKLCEGRHFNAPDLPCYGENDVPSSSPDNAVDHNVRATLLDTRGPEIRTGKLANDDSGHETVHLEAGNTINLRTSSQWAEQGSTAADLYIDYANLAKSLRPGMKVLLDDGAVTLTVSTVDPTDDGTVVCTIDNSAELRSRAGVNLPGAETDLPAMSAKDRVDIKYGMTKDIDFIAASFVQNADGVREIRNYVAETARELGWADDAPLPLIISKIESVAALRNFDAILDESDGIMVARGDLGVEIPIQQVTNAQKEMVAACNAAGKPVIVATQMLESMAKNPRPTRAEVADVTNAVYDGADAVMLSGETAKGKYPVETIQTMNEIIEAAEQFVGRRTDLVMGSGSGLGSPPNPAASRFGVSNAQPKNPQASTAKSAVTAAAERHATAILVMTKNGTLPRLVSAYRPNVPIVSFCPNSKVARQLMLHRGIHPVIGLAGVPMAKRPVRAIRHARAMGFVKPGDDVVLVTMEADDDMGIIGTMKVATVPGDEES